MRKSYISSGYNMVQKVIANCDKCSANNDSKVVRSPWGTFTMYRSSKRGRFYSVRGSKVLHNGGSYRIGTIKARLRSLVG